jgi:glycosyltransferase involved in cell wall biosynthesis
LKILFTSYLFSPSLGGIETVSSLLAPEFVRRGHEVVLVTTTREDDHVSRPYKVVRDPGAGELIGLTRWCDVLFQSNISLELAWPLLFIRRPWVISHQTMLLHPVENLSLRGRLKHYLFRFAAHAAISRSIADSLPVPSIILGNPFSPETFKLMPEIPRDREIVYLGRLVSDKGVDLLLEAVTELRQRGFTPRLTIIGSGPELANLQALADRLQISSQVEFTGPKKGAELAAALNAHQNMIVPSRWAEPFGVVVLEGIACGCAVIVSKTGGLPEAAGPCGVTFEPGNHLSLADAIQTALTQPQFRENLQLSAQSHLARFDPAVVAQGYLQLFEQALAGS